MPGTLATLRIMLTLDTSQVTAGLARVKAQTMGVASTMNAGLGLAGLALTAGFYESIKAAMQWEDEFANVKRTLDLGNVSTDQATATYGKLSAELLNLTTKIPVTAHEIAELASTAGALGVPAEAIVEFSRVAATLAALSDDLTPKAASFLIGKIRTITGLATSDLSKFGDTVVALGVSGASTEGEILNMTENWAGVAHLWKVSIPDMLGWSAAMANVGEEAEAGGTSIQRLFQGAGTAVATNSKDLVKWGAILGVTGDQFAQMFSADSSATMQAWFNKLAAMDPLVATAALTGIKGFGNVRIVRGVMKLAAAISGNTTGNLNDALGTANAAWNTQGAMAEQTAIRWDTAATKLKLLGNTFFNLGVTIGTVFLPYVSGAADAISGLVNGFNDLLIAFPVIKDVLGPILAVLAALAALKFGYKVMQLLLPTGPMGTALMSGWMGFMNSGFLRPITGRLAFLGLAIKDALVGQAGMIGTGGAGMSFMKAFVTGATGYMKGVGKVRMAAGIGSMMAGIAILANSSSFDMVGQLSGTLLTLVGAFAIGGPIFLAIAAFVLAIHALVDFFNQIDAEYKLLQAQTADAIANFTDQQLVDAINRLMTMRDKLPSNDGLFGSGIGSQQSLFDMNIGGVKDKNAAQIDAMRRELHRRAALVPGAISSGLDDPIKDPITGEVTTLRIQAVNALKSYASAIQEEWNTVATKIKPPENISYKDRLKTFTKAVNQARSQLAKSVAANDPVNVAFWSTRLVDTTAARDDFMIDGKTAVVDFKTKLEETGTNITGVFTKIKQDAADGALGVHNSTMIMAGDVTTMTNNIVTTTQSVDLTASGQHMMGTLINGVNSMTPSMIAAANGVAHIWYDLLGFNSPGPKVGPLKGIRQWGPNMVDNWLTSIPVAPVTAAANRLAGAMSPRGTMNMTGRMRHHRIGHRDKGTGDQYHFHIGTLIADNHGIDQLQDRMERRKRQRTRGSGRLVGDN